MGKTLFDKIWDDHQVMVNSDGTYLIYIDRHLLHEVTSPQAFSGLQNSNLPLWRNSANLAVADHNVPTTIDRNVTDPESKLQLETLTTNCNNFSVELFDLNHPKQGIVHVIGPELGYTLPGMTIVCGDSHTSTHGAFATISMGIGTTEVEHVLATQCLVQNRPKNLQINIIGKLQKNVTAKDLILSIIGKIGTAGATGYAIEYCGEQISEFSMESRMTMCNMSIEAGAKCGLIAVDNTTLDYVGQAAKFLGNELFIRAKNYWQTLYSDIDCIFDRVEFIDATEVAPQVTWGTSPGMVASIDAKIPNPEDEADLIRRRQLQHSLDYMGLKPNTKIQDIKPEVIFIGSCTNSRIEDLRQVAKIVKGKRISDSINYAMIVPGSSLVKKQAEDEGLDKIFTESGFLWRAPGCSMCLGMNADKLSNKQRSASTSNRNFEGRQGAGSRTHLVSPAMAAAAAIHGHFIDIREL